MRMTFIIPPSGFLLDERVFPSLGVLKVAAVLEQHGHSVDVLDLSGVTQAYEAVAQHVRAHPADLYGITATMPQMPSAVTIIQALREHRPGCRVILGGPHPTLMGNSAKQEAARGVSGRATRAFLELRALADVVVLGDGERAILEAIRPQAPAVIDAESPESPLFLHPAEIAEAPLPARHLLDIDTYRYQLDGHRTMSLIAQLGCPFGCAFCGGRRSPFLRRVRTRSTESVLAELEHLSETYGADGFMFLDDELNVNREFVTLLRGMIATQQRLGVTWHLRGLLKSELLTEEQADLMAMAGFRQVLVGFESGHPRILENIQKRATVEDNTRCVGLLRQWGITVKALMSIGHPGESAETIQATRDWLLDVRPTDFDVTIITVYPGTPYFDDARPSEQSEWTYTAKNGDRLHQAPVDHLSDVNFYKGSPHGYQSFVWTDALSSSALVQARDAMEDEVRSRLGIPYPQGSAAVNFEHSMGMS